MNKHIQNLLALFFTAIFLTACNSATVKPEPKGNKLISITISGMSRPGPGSSSYVTVIKNDLSTLTTTKTSRPDNIEKSKKKKKITQAQFDDLAKTIAKINLSKIKSIELKEPTVGGGSTYMTIKTDQGEYGYSHNFKHRYPKEIRKLSQQIRELF